MLEKVVRIIQCKQCPKCCNDTMYKLKDNRFKCSACFYKYSPGPIEKDWIQRNYCGLRRGKIKLLWRLAKCYKKF